MNVPLLDLQAQYRAHKPELDSALLRVAESQECILGKEVEAMEATLAEYCGARHALGVSSGTDALLMAMMALDIKPGDEVIMPTYSFFATAGTAARLGATPVFVDSDPLTFNINPGLIEEKITPRTKAIVPVNLFGQECDISAVMAIADRHGIPVIEDSAQSIGAEYKDGRKSGSVGLMGCYSFYPSKNLGAFGDGGLLTTNDSALFTKLKQMRVHGSEPKYYHKFVGGNFRLDALQAAVINVKIPHLEAWHSARRTNAALYNKLFVEAGLAQTESLSCGGFAMCPTCASDTTPEFANGVTVLLPHAVWQSSGVKNYHIYNQYTIRIKRRDALRSFLKDKGIGSEVYYPVPFHRQECFAYLSAKDHEYPVANCLAETALSLPIYPELVPAQIEHVVAMIAEFMRS